MSNSLPINHIPLLSNFYALTATQPVMINPTPATTQFAVPQIVTEIADIDAEKMMDNADWGTEGRVPGDEKLLLLVAACQDKAEEYQREQHKKQSAIDISARVGAVEKKSISPPASVVNEKLWEINSEHLRWHFQKTASPPLNLLDQDVNMPVVAFSDSEHICEEDIKGM
jgi:hypothetical protein